MSDSITHKACHVCGVNLRSLPEGERSLHFVDIGGVPDVGLCNLCRHGFKDDIALAWKTADENVDDEALRLEIRTEWRALAAASSFVVTFANEA